MEDQITNPNDLWSHALSKADDIEMKSKVAELEHIKDLFFNKLPVGENLKPLEEYFNELENVIFTKGPQEIKNEQFPTATPDVGEGEAGSYKYYSPSLLKELASGHKYELLQQDMDPSSDPQGFKHAVSGGHEESKSLPSISECSEGDDIDIHELVERIHDNNDL